MSQLLLDFAMLGYGSVRVYETPRASGDGGLFPSGELHPPLDRWVFLLSLGGDPVSILTGMREEVQTWKVRPAPPPEGETLDDLKQRILGHEGWEPKDVALACRCTPTLVRRSRTEAERNPETGREEGSLQHARDLLAQGMSLRQVAILTGISKSTLHRHGRVASGTAGQ